MNILPHKSWHVRNKDNVERVRRDEEKARVEEEKKAKRAALAEQEARTSLLRAKARSGFSKELARTSTSCTGSEVIPISDEPRHINFFQDIEQGVQQGTNTEYEAEKKAEQEKQEKAIGILTYLGQSASQKHGEHPWYLKKEKQQGSKEDESVRDAKRKDALDPLNKMKKYLEAKDFAKKKHKKHRKEHKKSKNKEEKTLKKKTLEELRAERLERENTERAREKALLSSSRAHQETTPGPRDDPYRYNSQFNPDLVRKPRNTVHKRYRPY